MENHGRFIFTMPTPKKIIPLKEKFFPLISGFDLPINGK